MEIYIPYIVGSTVSAFLGKIAYSYLTYQDNILDDLEINDTDLEINKNDYELINNKGIKERYWKPLGITFSDKSKTIKQICKDECGFEINNKKKKNERNRTLYYISQYEKIGHDDFVLRFIKKWKLDKMEIQ
jgi:hypothetical protein